MTFFFGIKRSETQVPPSPHIFMAGIPQVAAVGIGKLGYPSNTLILLYKQDSLPTSH